MDDRILEADLFANVRLRKGGDSKLARAVARGSRPDFQAAWRKLTRQPRRRFCNRFEDDACVTLWSADVLVESAEDRELAATVEASLRKRHTSRSRRSNAAPPLYAAEIADPLVAALCQQATPFSVLMAAELLLREPQVFSPEAFAGLCQILSEIDPDRWPDQTPPGAPETVQQVRYAVTHGEIPWILGLLLSPLKQSRSWLRQGRSVLRRTLDDATDTDGMLNAAVTERLRNWMSPLVRASAWGQAFEESWLTKKGGRHWKNATQQAALLVNPEGVVTEPEQPGTADEAPPTVRILWHAAILAGHATSSATGSLLKAPRRKRSKKSRHTGKASNTKNLNAPARNREVRSACNQSDWAALAVLRSGLHVDADLATLSWHRAIPDLSLTALGVPLLSGPWNHSIRIASQEIAVAEEWGCSCWFQDKDVAFVELTCELAGGVQVVRQLMLSLADHFAIACESVTCPDASAPIQFDSRLRLVAGETISTDPVTRELQLHQNGLPMRVIPAWLDDDRVINTPGDVGQDDGDLILSAEGIGGLTVPLVLDWHPKRNVRDADWNRLTVTENRVPQTSRQAAGFRVRIGRLQLLLYRSLQPAATLRAVLGHHTNNETVYGYVRNSGEIDPLVIVDGAEEEK